MEKYDVLVIGAATSGAFFAERMAAKGYSVKVIEKLSQDKLGRRLDIFHVRYADFLTFGLPIVHEGDPEWAFEFENGYTAAPSGKYPKLCVDRVVGMHMAEYIALMIRNAEAKGATFEYSAAFVDFLFEDGKICGVTYKNADGAEANIFARVVVDCTGTAAVPRAKLPAGYGVETFELTPEDVFYVILRYVRFKNPTDSMICENGKLKNTGYPFFKSWIAPCADPEGAIIGIGACHSYDYAESIYKKFEQSVPVPEYEITRIERGTTPYTRTPYSFVGDNFIVTGDAGCLTKPINGEGVTSSMVQMEIAVDVLDGALKKGDTSRAGLWDINVRYNKGQGADFAGLRAAIIKALPYVPQAEFEHVFRSDMLSDKLLAALLAEGGGVGTGDIIKIVFKLLGAIIGGKIKIKTLKLAKAALDVSGKLSARYKNFPQSPEGYDEWVKETDRLWQAVGKME